MLGRGTSQRKHASNRLQSLRNEKRERIKQSCQSKQEAHDFLSLNVTREVQAASILSQVATGADKSEIMANPNEGEQDGTRT